MALPEQVSRLAVTTLLFGEILAALSKLGAVLVTVADALLVAVAFKESVNVATQVKSALGAELLDDKVRLAPLATKVPLTSCQFVGGCQGSIVLICTCLRNKSTCHPLGYHWCHCCGSNKGWGLY